MSLLKNIQQEVTNQILSFPAFANVPVLNENVKDLQSMIDIGLGTQNVSAGKQGLVVIVLTPNANCNWRNMPGPFFDDIDLVVSVWENVQTNRIDPYGTLLQAADAAEQICIALSSFMFFPLTSNSPIMANTPTVRLVPDPDYLRYDCRFKVMGGLSVVPPQLDTPVIMAGGGNINSITSTTPGVGLFYTLDGSNPTPRNPASKVYSGPSSPGVGLLVKAQGWLSGYFASAVATGITT